MELIRPLYFVREEDIIFWKNKFHFIFLSRIIFLPYQQYMPYPYIPMNNENIERQIIIINKKIKERAATL